MTMKSIDILVAEDNEDDVVLIREAFAEGKLANRITIVRDGVEALAYLRGEGGYRDAPLPGIVLLDINMPRKSGFEVLMEAKADLKLRAVPIVMLTVSEREEDIVRSFSEGACSYVRKPVTLNRFVAVIKEFELYWTLVSKVPAMSR